MRRYVLEADPPAAEMLGEVFDELRRAEDKFGPFHSAHEGYAILLEEVDELWQEIKHGTKDRVHDEAVQVAAMAIRFLKDLCVKDVCNGAS